jgi:hypothetical protein
MIRKLASVKEGVMWRRYPRLSNAHAIAISHASLLDYAAGVSASGAQIQWSFL